jgi:hypothetical protein
MNSGENTHRRTNAGACARVTEHALNYNRLTQHVVPLRLAHASIIRLIAQTPYL